MKIKKRNGRLVNFNPSKIIDRFKNKSDGLNVDTDKLAIAVISQMIDGISTKELDVLCVEVAAGKVPSHPDYGMLAGRIFITSLRKEVSDFYSSSVLSLDQNSDSLSQEYVHFVIKNKYILDDMIEPERDFNHDIFGLKTLERSYLLKDREGNILETPQYMWMRCAIEVTGFDISRIKETYDAMSQGFYTHATPTLFNAGTKLSQLSSCFLLANKGDSIDGLFDTMKDVAKISKLAGGIGLHVHNVRAKGSLIVGTNGQSDGLIPMMKTYNEIARWINQGGKRKGSFAMYLEPWHADIYDFIELRKNHGKEEMRARDLFYAIWMNDLFMERVKEDGNWTLFCPNEILKYNGTVLQELHGDEFYSAYVELEMSGIGKEIKARDLWSKILVSQMETGTPYIGYKDAVNSASNQKNLGTIQSSNLCIEINEYSDKDEQAVCNLASIALPKFVEVDAITGDIIFNWNEFRTIIRLAVRNLDNVIDANYYPTPETKVSNIRHRPIGLGVQGLADVFAMMKLSFDSQRARDLNRMIFESMYYYALEESCLLARERGEYSSFAGSPASMGILQFDMYEEGKSHIFNWNPLRKKIVKHGLRNSLLIALMPTASTSQILGNNECFEPFTSNIYTRGTLSGTFVIINKHLVRDLEEIGLWDDNMKDNIMRSNGSIMNIPSIPVEIKERYKTAYEISMKSVIDMAADRQRYICQAQSMNLFMTDITIQKLNSMHFYGWERKLKTGMYYLRSKSAVDAIKITLSNEEKYPKAIEPEEFKAMIDQAKNQEDDDCDMCGS